MKKFIFLFLLSSSLLLAFAGERTPTSLDVYGKGTPGISLERDRAPIHLPISVFYDSDKNAVEVWCDNDNIQAEVFVYDEAGILEVYSPYMNVILPLKSGVSHTIIIQNDYWYAEGVF